MLARSMVFQLANNRGNECLHVLWPNLGNVAVFAIGLQWTLFIVEPGSSHRPDRDRCTSVGNRCGARLVKTVNPCKGKTVGSIWGAVPFCS